MESSGETDFLNIFLGGGDGDWEGEEMILWEGDQSERSPRLIEGNTGGGGGRLRDFNEPDLDCRDIFLFLFLVPLLDLEDDEEDL